MEDKSLSSTEPSILLWAAVGLLIALGARAFIEYLYRVHHIGPKRGWREVVLGGLALGAGIWAGTIVGISSQGLPYDVGYHPAKVLAVLVGACTVAAGVLALTTRYRGLPTQVVGAVVLAVMAASVQMGVIWSVGPAPGLKWRIDLAAFSTLILLAGCFVALRVVLTSLPRATNDTRLRRLLTALLVAVAMLASQELVLLSADLPHQVVSSYARMVPEVALSLLAGVGVPIMLVVMLIDQRMQRRARRAHRRKVKSGFYASRLSEFAESRFEAMHDPHHGH